MGGGGVKTERTQRKSHDKEEVARENERDKGSRRALQSV